MPAGDVHSAKDREDQLWEIVSQELAAGWLVEGVPNVPPSTAGSVARTPSVPSEQPPGSNRPTTRVQLFILEKTKEDGSTKFRLLKDYTACGVNDLTTLTETVALPTWKDVRQALQRMSGPSERPAALWVAELDVANASRLVPVRKAEQGQVLKKKKKPCIM